MTELEFWDKHYKMSAQQSNDRLCVSKNQGTDWSKVEMITNDFSNGTIQIRSKEMAEQLHFMLGQMLRG